MIGTDYRHDLLQAKVKGDRRFNVARFCREAGITRTHFYDIINGAANVSEKTVMDVAKRMGFEPGEIIPEGQNQSSLRKAQKNPAIVR